MATNIIVAKFCADQTRAWTDELWQYDYGQVLVFDGIDLPVAYEVHFANQPHGVNSTTQIGNADGVTIPDQFLQSGEVVYAWVYLHTGEDDGETEYMVTIPVSKRAKPTNQTPTPVQQDAITESIAALNAAVEDADELAREWENMSATAETLPEGSAATASYSEGTLTLGIPRGDTGAQGIPGPDGEPGQPGADGFSPEITVQDITGGHRITITDATGTKTVDVMDGEDGQPGQPGQPGATGNGIASITKTGTVGLVDTYTITYTNGQTTTFTVTNGSDATVTVDDELSSTSENPVQNKVIDSALSDLIDDLNELSGSIAPVETSTTATAAHAVGELFMMGETLMVALSAIAVGDTITTEGGSPNAAVTKLTDKLLKDVQVNGTSVVTDGVANVPLADISETPGVVKIASGNGLTIDGTILKVSSATSSLVKEGTNIRRPIVPSNQHNAVFYGLAKAASDTTQSSSSNPVGTYTDDAKVKIQKMLGIYEAPWELIREDTVTNATEADIDITVDGNGNPFELTDVILLFETPQQETASAKGSSGQIRLYHGLGSINSFVAEVGAWTQAANATAHGAYVFFNQDSNIITLGATAQITAGNNGTYRYRYSANEKGTGVYFNTTGTPIGIIRVLINTVTGTGHYKLYGKRKWS